MGLLERIKNIPVDQFDWSLGFSGACRGGHLEIAQQMISHGANAWNPGLHGACQGGHPKIVQTMLANGADPHILDQYPNMRKQLIH